MAGGVGELPLWNAGPVCKAFASGADRCRFDHRLWRPKFGRHRSASLFPFSADEQRIYADLHKAAYLAL